MKRRLHFISIETTAFSVLVSVEKTAIFIEIRSRRDRLLVVAVYVDAYAEVFKMMNFVLKMMKYALQMMDFVLQMMKSALQMMDCVLKMMNSALQMMSFFY